MGSSNQLSDSDRGRYLKSWHQHCGNSPDPTRRQKELYNTLEISDGSMAAETLSLEPGEPDANSLLDFHDY